MDYMLMLERRIEKLERACYDLNNLSSYKLRTESTLFNQFKSEYIKSEIEDILTDCSVETDDSRTDARVISITISKSKKSATYKILAKDHNQFGLLYCKDSNSKNSIGECDSLDECINKICDHFKQL